MSAFSRNSNALTVISKSCAGLPEDQCVHYISICSPNYLHDAHVRFALRVRAVPICEKPLSSIRELRCPDGAGTGVRDTDIHNSPAQATSLDGCIPREIALPPSNRKHEVVLTYITSRGDWYLYSWKGNAEQSGGLATNIGIHFFDILVWLFGPVEFSEVHVREPRRSAGYLELNNARVRWFLSIDRNDLPPRLSLRAKGHIVRLWWTVRRLNSPDGFEDLHTRSYEMILAGRGFGVEEARPSTQLVHDIRSAKVTGICGNSHPGVRRLWGKLRCVESFRGELADKLQFHLEDPIQ